MDLPTEKPEGTDSIPGATAISLSDALRTLSGVITAAKADARTAHRAVQLVTDAFNRLPSTWRDLGSPGLKFKEWSNAFVSELVHHNKDMTAQEIRVINVTLAISFMRHQSRANRHVSLKDLEAVWVLIHQTLLASEGTQGLFAASRSAQGFLTVPLCSLLDGKDIDELFRLHVWLPDGHRGNPDFAVHSHQPFIQAWILAGEGTDHLFKVEPTTGLALATHAEYTLTWKASEKPEQGSEKPEGEGDNAYKTHQSSSTAVNTGKLVRVECTQSVLHKRGTSYTVPAGAHHQSEVSPVALHATLCFFDSHRGFIRDAPALGPVEGTSFTQHRDPAAATPSSLASSVETVRMWEFLIEQGQSAARRAELEEGLRYLNRALIMCNYIGELWYKHHVEGLMGCLYRRFGRYPQAEEWLRRCVDGLERPDGADFIEFSGELVVVYRHMGRLADAKRLCELQCAAAAAGIARDRARRLHFERSLCRAVGNLAMVNYQLYEKGKSDKTLLDLAISQQLERVRRARDLQEVIPVQATDQATRALWLRDAITWETIGFSRLSLYYSAQGRTKEAIDAARESLELTRGSSDSTVLAMSRFFYGRALLLDGQHDAALVQFDLPPELHLSQGSSGGICTPAIALCKEPSTEHREYLRELVEAGADMDPTDEHGYSALDYAIFSGDPATVDLILDGMRRKLTANIPQPEQGVIEETLRQRLTESNLRKGYRDLFQEKLRPVLQASSSNRDPTALLQTLRRVYDDTLASDAAQRSMFDGLKFLRFSEFLEFGRLPRSTDKLARDYNNPTASNGRDELIGDRDGDGGGSSTNVSYIIFFSYRWINKDPGATSPDDRSHTQFRRMITAAELFMELHRDVKPEELGLWVDFACVDQDDPIPGVSALPMILSQCNAVISLTDDEYYHRAWCSVEVMVAQTLAKSYRLHRWYEHVYDTEGDGSKGRLREGPLDMEIVMSDKLLSFERDRPKVLFLERQSRLLG